MSKKEDKKPEKKTDKNSPQKPVDSLLAKKLATHAKIMKKHGASDYNPEGGRIASDRKSFTVYPTGLETLDKHVLGIGGIVAGSMIEISGIESSGKSAFAYFLIAQVQRQIKEAIAKIYDVEDAWTDAWGEQMGCDLKRTLLPEIWGAESVSSQTHEDLASEFPPEIITIDSLAVMQPQQLMKKDVKDHSMHDKLARASFLTQYFNSIRDGFWFPPANKKTGELLKTAKQVKLGQTPTVMLCVNHTKPRTEKKGSKSITTWETVGGMSLNFHASVRLSVRRLGYTKVGNDITHQEIEVKAFKNKFGPPQRTAKIKLSFKGGLEQMAGLDYLTMAIEKKLAELNGAWISSAFLPGGKIQGRDAFNQYVDATPAYKDVILA